jgi:hypothetical protein
MSIRNRAALLCLALFFTQAHAEGIGGGIGGSFGGIGQGVGSPDGVATSKLNLIALAPLTILNTTPIGVTTITATLIGPHTGGPGWSISDPSGTFTINSSTGVLSVASTTALTIGNTIPITINSTATPAPPAGHFTITVVGACTNSFDFSQACNSQYLGFM